MARRYVAAAVDGEAQRPIGSKVGNEKRYEGRGMRRQCRDRAGRHAGDHEGDEDIERSWGRYR
jgi:hypothetical protein